VRVLRNGEVDLRLLVVQSLQLRDGRTVASTSAFSASTATSCSGRGPEMAARRAAYALTVSLTSFALLA